MKYEMKRVGIFSVVKISFVLGGAAGFLGGFIAGLIFMMFASFLSSMPMPSDMGDFGGMAEGLGIVTLFMAPFVYGFFGSVFGAIYGLIAGGVYNLAARLIGGLEWEMAPAEGAIPPTATPPPPPPEQPKRVPPSMYE